MPSFTLYRVDGACSLAAHALLQELGADFKSVIMKKDEEERLMTADGSINAEGYRKIHPEGLVPALTVDNQSMSENVAILTYLGSLAPEKKLNGKNDFEHSRVLEWLAFLANTLQGRGYGMFFTPERFSTDKTHVEAIRAKGRAKIEESYASVDRRLGDKPFPVGDAETVADYYMIPMYFWGMKTGFDMEKYPNYGKVIRRMMKNKGVQAAMKDEGLQDLINV